MVKPLGKMAVGSAETEVLVAVRVIMGPATAAVAAAMIMRTMELRILMSSVGL
jgi:hypothetical protein